MAKHFHLVEGPYKNFTIRRVRPQDVDKVVEHIKDYFLKDEPVSQLLGYSELYGTEFCHIFKYFLSHDMSFWMEDNDTGEVAAVRAISLETEDVDPWLTFPRTCCASKIFYEIGEKVHETGDLFERYQVDKMADYLLVSCHPKYRRQGLSKELYKRTIEFLKAEGVPLVKSVFTSPYTRKAVKALGFEEVCRLHLKDVRDEDGSPAFDSLLLNEEHYVSLMAKRIL